MTINSLLEGANPYKAYSSEAEKFVNKWARTGLLEGLDGHENEKTNMAVLLENQAKQLVQEANTLGARGTGASFSGGDSEAWAGVALPLVRRVFGEIVAKDLVSVQPMNLPSGLIFYLDFQYGNNRPGFVAGESLYAATADQKKNQLPDVTDPARGLYGAGRFGYTINATSSGVTFTAASSSVADVNYDAIFVTGTTNLTDIDTLTVANASTQLPGFDVEGIRAFNVSGSGITNFFPQFTTYNAATDTAKFVIKGTAADAVVEFHVAPVNLDDRGDYEDTMPTPGSGLNSQLEIPEINVQMRSDQVTAKTRKLKAQWTPEFAQDLNAYHSIDAEAELTSLLSEYISMEIDLEILDMLIQNVDTVNHWSAKVGVEVDENGTAGAAGSNEYYTRMSWFQTLGIKLQSVSNTIHQKTLRGGANFMVVSPRVSTILESIPGFAADSFGDKEKYAMGVQKIGAINSRYTVYKNPYMLENTILMGYKGSQFLETGAVFAPYIPLIMTPLVYDPVSFTPRKGIMTRYAKKMVRPDFYGKIVLHNLNTI
jgi:hypothetical protein